MEKEMTQKIKETVCSNYMLISSATLLAFTFCIFGPIQLFISNIKEFWFSIGDVVYPSIIAFIAIFSILIAVGLLLREKLKEWFSCLVFGLAIALYIQGNFVFTDYGVLDGSTINWSSYKSEAIINSIIWIICIASPFVLRFLKITKLSVILTSISTGIILVQIITLGTLVITTDLKNQSKFYISMNGLYEISEEENVVIFILDMFDVDYLREIIEFDEDFLKPLDGFTNYNNATGSHPTTFGSLSYILTGQYYKNEQKFSDYFDEAYSNTNYYRELKSEGYDIGIYAPNWSLSNEFANQYTSNNISESIKVLSSYELGKKMLQFTAFTHFPHIAKSLVWLDTGIFDELKGSSADKGQPYTIDNLSFYNPLNENGLFINDSDKSYRFIHLFGPHYPHTLAEDITVAPRGEATHYTQAKASLNIVYKYIEQLKRLNVYDNTMIIITADHGNVLKGRYISSPLLLVKPFDQHDSFEQSEAPVSHGDLHATVMDALGLNISEKYGVPIQDISETSQRTRSFFYYQHDDLYDKEYLADMEEYIISPNGNGNAYFYRTGLMYTPEGKIDTGTPYSYTFGEVLNFSTEAGDNGRDYLSGISTTEKSFTWSLGKTSILRMNFEPVKGDLVVQIELGIIFNGKQNVQISSVSKDGSKVELFNELTTHKFSFDIPNELVEDGNLILEFEYENAASPKSLGMNDDTRVLAIGFKEIIVSSKEDIKYEKPTKQDDID